MKLRYETCVICGLQTTPANMLKHLRKHERESREPKKPTYTLDHDDLFCKFCRKECKNTNSLCQHEMRCSENPNRIPSSIIPQFHRSNRVPWNKGLTAQTDARVAKQAEAQRKSKQTREIDELEPELDDDGKLYMKYKAKCYNGQHQNHPMLMTFHEYCQLVKDAGLKSSDLGYHGNKYDLARYNDEGPYAVGNCRFITHLDNLLERSDIKSARLRNKRDNN